MSTWTPTNTSELRNISDDDIERFALVPAHVRTNDDDVARVLRDAKLTNVVPARWTRW